MQSKKNKNIAAVLAFLGGIVGLQRFYLGQKGMGFLMIIIAFFTMGLLSSFIGIIDSIVFLNMSEEKFDKKYNDEYGESSHFNRRPRYKSYERRTGSYEYQTQQNRDSMHRKDRRIDPEEYFNRKRGKAKTNHSPYRAKENKKRRRKPRKKEVINEINKYKNSGIDKFKEYDIEGAIQDFVKILKIDPYNIAANFNIACAYSQLEKPEKVMHHLSVAVKAGFDDFDKIKKHEKLAYARIQPEWEKFEKNGFIFDVYTENEEEKEIVEKDTSQPKIELEEKDIEQTDLLENLTRLKELRDRGVLSELEFELERRKLMSSE